MRSTSDGVLVIYHDWFVPIESQINPDIQKQQLISHTSFKELRDYCRSDGFELATLEQVLSRYGNRIDLNIEIKAADYEQAVIDMIYEFDVRDSVLLSSFGPWIVRKLKYLDSTLKTGWVVGQERILKVNRMGRILLSFIFEMLGADTAHLHYEMITPEIISRFHARNIPVFTWTVNDANLMKQLIDLGVDGIISNKPGLLYAVANDELPVERKSLMPGTRLALAGGAYETGQDSYKSE